MIRTLQPQALSNSKMPHPRKIRAVLVEKTGGPEVLQEVDYTLPAVGPKQVLIRMKVSGINDVELKIRAGRVPFASPPTIIGMDGAGVIEEVGKEIKRFKKGDRVYFCKPDTGSYATFCLALEENVYHLPAKLSFEEGAILPIPYLTVHRSLVQLAGMKKGDTILVQGASGAVGLAAIQMAKGLGASRIIGTAGTEEGKNLARQAGADIVRDYKANDFEKNLRNDIGPKGFDVILETNADVNLDMDLSLITTRGAIVIAGKHGECRCEIGKVLPKETRIFGIGLYFAPPEARLASAEDINEYINEGWLKPFVGKRYQFKDVKKTHEDLAARKGALGKNVMIIEQ